MSSNTPAGPSQERVTLPVDHMRDIALSIYKYARRWVVGQAPDPRDAMVYDVAMSVLRAAVAPKTIGSTASTAAEDRYQRYGYEGQPTSYRLPTDPVDALVVLHRFARHYTNGRGTYTASLVNDAARSLLAAGVSLQETHDLDGSIWAADGVGGETDGLTPEQRAEARAALRQVR